MYLTLLACDFICLPFQNKQSFLILVDTEFAIFI